MVNGKWKIYMWKTEDVPNGKKSQNLSPNGLKWSQKVQNSTKNTKSFKETFWSALCPFIYCFSPPTNVNLSVLENFEKLKT